MLAEKNESMIFNEIAFCSNEKQNNKWRQFHACDLKQQTRCSDNELVFVIIYLFIYLWLLWVLVAACGLSLGAASWGYSSL